MLGNCRVSIRGEITKAHTTQATDKESFKVTLMVAERYAIKTPTGTADKTEFHTIVLLGGSAIKADSMDLIGAYFITDSGFIRTQERLRGKHTSRISKILTYECEIWGAKEKVIPEKMPAQMALNNIRSAFDSATNKKR